MSLQVYWVLSCQAPCQASFRRLLRGLTFWCTNTFKRCRSTSSPIQWMSEYDCRSSHFTNALFRVTFLCRLPLGKYSCEIGTWDLGWPKLMVTLNSKDFHSVYSVTFILSMVAFWSRPDGLFFVDVLQDMQELYPEAWSDNGAAAKPLERYSVCPER